MTRARSLALLVPLSGCAAPDAAHNEAVRTLESGSEIDNALSPNALSPNALSPNALSPNALSPNALSPNALSPTALASIQDPSPAGELSRMLLKYTVSCALSSSQSFSFTWTDGAGNVHAESYPGQLGIAPAWAAAPLDTTSQQLVSGCLAARTNWYGVRVIISLRYIQGVLHVVTDGPENLLYSNVEGGFWGNLFSPTPYLRACYNPSTVSNSRAAQRDCAAGHLGAGGAVEECGMIEIVGSCATACSFSLLGQHYVSCSEPDHGATTRVVTTALPLL